MSELESSQPEESLQTSLQQEEDTSFEPDLSPQREDPSFQSFGESSFFFLIPKTNSLSTHAIYPFQTLLRETTSVLRRTMSTFAFSRGMEGSP